MLAKVLQAKEWLAAFSFFTLLLGTMMAYQQENRNDSWKKVEQARNEGLPKTAIEILTTIADSALAEKKFGEAIKAIAMRASLESSLEGNNPEASIKKLAADLAIAPAEAQPILHAIQARFFWNYFENNRWRFGQRTTTAVPTGDDFTTWDLKRLFDQIAFHYEKALEAEDYLRSMPVASFEPLLKAGTLPDSYRPTLFDFVAFEAINFYSAGEQAGAKAEDAFEIEASSPALGTTADFLAWEPITTDANSVKMKAVKLYQKLLRLHSDDSDQSAYLDAELGRLQFCHANAVGEEKNERYLAALKSFAETNAKHELSATARHRWALLLMERGDRVAAREVAQQGFNTFPKSVGGISCKNLIAEIESKSLSAVTERVWDSDKSTVRVAYRNVNKAYFRLHKADWLARFKQYRSAPNYLNGDEWNSVKNTKPDFEWNADLAPTEDYQDSTQDVSIPHSLKPGFYYLLTSSNASFSNTNNVVSLATVWVSHLSLVVDQNTNNGTVDGFLLDSKTGTPIADATIRAFTIDHRNNTTKETSAKTKADGRFSFSMVNQAVMILAEHKGHMLAARDFAYTGQSQPPQRPNVQYTMFTDRALYRPGQTVHFKGIVLSVDQANNKYNTVSNIGVSVELRDINGQVIETKELTSNAFGSFSGTFDTPRDRGTGHMTLLVNGIQTAGVQVEEYKRPKFEVTLGSPKESPKLNDEVVVIGKALSYTGMPIQGAKVTYRVNRSVRWPIWFSYCFPWRMPPQSGSAQEIAHGVLQSEPDGTFKITFLAKPDRSVNESDSPQFHYSITADVTDTTGETRSSSSSVTVGYVALQANMTTSDWNVASSATKIALSTTSLNGDGVAASGKIKLFTLKQPESVIRPDLLGAVRPAVRRGRAMRGNVINPPAAPADPSNIATWETADLVEERGLETNDAGSSEQEWKLGQGVYRAVVETQDRFGKPVTSMLNFKVVDPSKSELGIKVPSLVVAPKWSVEPGESFTALWGTGYDKGQAYVELSLGSRVLQSYWTKPNSTQTNIEQKITEEMRGGLTLRVLFVRENNSYIEQRNIDVPWTNKELKIRTEYFTSKLEPGAKDKVKLIVEGPQASKVVSELVAGMYDASLDAYMPHYWRNGFGVFRNNYRWGNWSFSNFGEPLNFVDGQFTQQYLPVPGGYRSFDPDILLFSGGMMMARGGRAFGGRGGYGAPADAMMAEAMFDAAPGAMGGMPAAPMMMKSAQQGMETAELSAAAPDALVGGASEGGSASNLNLGKVAPRKNLQELAFFFPHVTAKEDGAFEIEFTMPEALTTWRFMAFAHDTELRAGFLENRTITSKDIMVQPNPPRFLREGDVIEFTVKVSNSSSQPQIGMVALKLFDVSGTRSVDEAFANVDREKAFELGAGESKSYAWRLQVPDGSMPVLYKAIGGTEKTSDGEEGILPVLSKRILVTESLPLPIRGKQTKEFEFSKLLVSAQSDTLKHESLTVQMVSQPAWYAVLALPYLMEYQHECSEQTFNRMYSNILARHIANSDPKIRRIFDAWKNIQPEALDSPLEKNQDLKSVMIEETPWLRAAKKESQARRDVGILFDDGRLNSEIARAQERLLEMQRENGMFPWFPGGPDNEYLTLYIMTGYGRMRHLGVDVDTSPALRTIARLDAWIEEKYRWILANSKDPEAEHLSSPICLYLYGRSFFLEDAPIPEQHRVAVEYWKRQASKYWLSQPRQNQAQLAIGLNRFGDEMVPGKIVKSIVEFSKTDEELGMYWEASQTAWWWYHAPVETQAILIEMFDEVAKDKKLVEECKVWLLKQKQTQAWKTTKSTADAVYALLLRGNNLLASDSLVEVQLAGSAIKPEKVEVGTGFYEQRFLRTEIKPEFGKIKVVKSDEGVSWGSVHWQYLEDISKITPHDGTPLKLEKEIYRKVQTKSGEVLEAIDGPVQIGDELVTRLVLRTDRDMEFVHLKDHRGSGTEPVNVLSGYRYRDGFGYYESTRDTASHFFIDYLPKGNYVFEYSVRVQHAGEYPSGMATIQSMYAPEFNSHSGSVFLKVSGR
ncbi:alpha-2-macroglobulin family protein [Pirellulaceae bacterium SH449]